MPAVRKYMLVFENGPPGFLFVFEHDPHLCLDMTLGFLGPKMMSPTEKMSALCLKIASGMCLKMTPLPAKPRT